MEALPAAVAAGVVLLIISLFDILFIENAIGNTPDSLNVVIPANLIGVLGGIVLALVMVALHGLSEGQERIGRLILLASS